MRSPAAPVWCPNCGARVPPKRSGGGKPKIYCSRNCMYRAAYARRNHTAWAERPVPEHGTPGRYNGCSTRPPCRCLICRAGAAERRRAARVAAKARRTDA